MKTMRRIFSILLVAALMLSLTLAVFADATTPHTITVENPEGLTFSLYDIQGRQLANSNLPIFNYHFSTPGVYLLKSVGVQTRKIVITR